MKRIYILTILLLTANSIFAQEKCRELFITEIVFGQNGSYSVEVFNSTEQTVQLSDYEIQLLGYDVDTVNITLSGSVNAHSTTVISKVNSSNGPISDASDLFSLLLDFQEKSVIQLVKNDTIILDRIGNIHESPSVIDITQLLTDPNYINELDIDLGSITDLLIRRKGTIQEGKVNFENADIVGDWEIYPNYFLQNLGTHINACMNPIIEWDVSNQFIPELIIDENDPWPIYADVRITGYLYDDVDIFLMTGGPNFFMDSYLEAIVGFDFWYPNMYYTIPAGPSGIETIQVSAGLIDNNIYQGNKGAGFSMFMYDDNGTGAIIGSNWTWDILIIEDEEKSTTGINEEDIDYLIHLFPTVADNEISIEIANPNTIIESIFFYSSDGKINKITEVEKNKKINIDFLKSSGYYLASINTNKGNVKKRFIKK